MRKKFFAVALAATMALSSAISAFAATAITGDLTVTTFFNEKTDMVELKSGDSYTFTFKDKSNGTNNFENYVMAIVGATGEAYKGADQEVLILRADRWGWGGGMSDFVAPDKDGNKLAFTGDEVVWDTWKAAMQAGSDVTVKIARDGNKLTYSSTCGGASMSLEATSGKALPESCYIFFTGEKCSLTGFKTVKNNATATTTDTTAATTAATTTTDKAAQTGDASATTLFVLAMVGVSGVLVALKRRNVTE